MTGSQAPSPLVSVLIPVYNGALTMPPVLEALYRSTYTNFEVVVVNDCSPDNSLEVLASLAERYPHRLIDFKENQGVSKARNAAAREARGEIILFIDSDCIVLPDTIALCVERLQEGECISVGGAYTLDPWDKDFFSIFQSIYIHHAETKVEHPDYIATHCMAIRKETFDEFGGFLEDYFIGQEASVEDVELSHRLIEAGHKLCRPREIMVQHMFRFDLKRSVKNAIKKSKYWTMYSLFKGDLMNDSGAASYELKVNVFSQCLNLALVATAAMTGSWWLLVPVALLYALNVAVSFRLLSLFQRERGTLFLLKAMAYYQFFYCFVVAYGSAMGMLKYIWEVKLLKRYA
ncbi:MAG: glycosyltransferase [Gaiellales bacterium]|nr:MAG: glycosyltransferase [Gaiellales bacterium]